METVTQTKGQTKQRSARGAREAAEHPVAGTLNHTVNTMKTTQTTKATSTKTSTPAQAEIRERSRRRLSFREQRELEDLPAAIETLEQEKAALTAAMCTPDYHRTLPERMRVDAERLATIDADIDAAMTRWEELEGRRA